jgi:hypothetical protein
MFKFWKIVVVGLVLIGCFNSLNGEESKSSPIFPAVFVHKDKKIPKSNTSYIPGTNKLKNDGAPKKVLLNDEYIKVNSRDTIFVQTIQFPLMTDAEKVFATKRITDYRSSKIKQFIDSFYNRDKVKDEYTQEFSYTQRWNFQIVYQSQTELSMKLCNYEFTGGAHGNTTVKSFNLDLKNLKGFKVSEKFPNLDTAKVAEYCTNYCLNKDIPIFDNVINPSPELFNVWNFTNEGLLLTFPQYSIAPYSSGIIEIHIANKDLGKLMIKN